MDTQHDFFMSPLLTSAKLDPSRITQWLFEDGLHFRSSVFSVIFPMSVFYRNKGPSHPLGIAELVLL